MSPREKIITILQGRKPDYVPWFGDLDYWATALSIRGLKPPDFIHSPAYIKWHSDLNVGFYLQGYYPFKPVHDFKEKIWNEGNKRFREIFTPKGNLRECWTYIPESFSEAPVEYLLKDEKDLPAMRFFYENTHWEKDYEFALVRKEHIEEQGIMMGYLPKSPFMQLVALEAGIFAVTITELTAPEEFKETLSVIKKCFDKAAHIAVDSPVDALFLPENLSSEVVGPNYFNKYMKTHHEEWAGKIREAGKYSFIHMDGTLRGLLREEAAVGFSVIEAMTPKPVGDLSVDEWRKFTGETDTIFWGGIPGSYFTALIDDEEFDRHIIETLAVMKENPKFVIGVADQVPPDGLENRVRRVGELVELYGKYE
jgi:uroporphyrinogen-III decarboxylase